MPIEKILVVDDDPLVRNFAVEAFSRKKLEVTAVEDGSKAIDLLKDQEFDLIISDMKMPGLNGIDLLRKIKELNTETIFVVITAYGSIENAVEAMRLGAFNYLVKPFSVDHLEAVIAKANEHLALIAENRYLKQHVSTTHRAPHTIISESAAMKQLISEIPRIAQSNASVFISGESGTGKEVFAHAIHYNSNRAQKPFIKVNCAAIPETLIESEFFGHEKGSFTGANTKRCGRFELAHEGTLLLDEITETPAPLQAKLLRVTEQQEFERVGGTKPIKVDVRLIATSNRDIKDAIAKKILREDLYYRLNVIPIYIPPLRERLDDIIPLTEYFLDLLCKENHKSRKKLSERAKKKLLEYHWPGNIRELTNIIERAVVLNVKDVIEVEHLNLDNPLTDIHASTLSAQVSNLLENQKGMTLRELEKKFIIETLQAQNNDRKKAAKQLGISLRTLESKLDSM